MLTRQEGLTQTYNRFHDSHQNDPDLDHLRALHRHLDTAVAHVYGWQDIDLAHNFYDTPQGQRYTISQAAQREILGRLLELNHQRYAEEVAASLHSKKKSKKQPPTQQPRLFKVLSVKY